MPSYSTICHECADRGDLMAEAELWEAEWETHPIEVSERKCRICGYHLHWWFFSYLITRWEDSQ